MFDNLRFALRQLLKSPGFALAAILSLALGIGANSAIFSVVNSVLRNPAGVDHADRVAINYVRYKQFGLDVPVISVPDYADAANLKPEVDEAAIEQNAAYNIVHENSIQHLSAAQVSWRWFQVFGARPIVGRTFLQEEDQPGASAVAVLSYSLWQNVFGGRHDAIGQTILLDRKPYRVVGVMRSDFDWPRGKQVWTPLALAPAAYSTGNRFNENYLTAVRLKAGVTMEQFNARYAAKMRDEMRSEGNSKFAGSSGWSVVAIPLTEYAAGALRKPLFVLFAVVLLVLLIAAANVAGLLLARVSARSREFAIRTALGASAGAMIRQLLVETLLLVVAATGLGIVAAPVLGKLVLVSVPHSLAEGFSVEIDPAVLLFTAAVAVLTCLVAGLGPALNVVRLRAGTGLHEGSRSVTLSADKHSLRTAFVIGEVALAFVLLAGTGLFLISLKDLQQVSPGFNPRGVLAAKVIFSGDEMKKSQPRQTAFVASAMANLRAQPGVESVAAIEPLPFDDGKESGSFEIQGQPMGPNEPGPHSQISLATPAYLKVMKIPLLRGRWFNDGDRDSSQPVTVIDDRLARHYFPGQDPLGQHVRSGRNSPWVTVVGEVATIRFGSLEEDTSDGMRYFPFAQQTSSYANFVVRANGSLNSLVDPVKRAISAAETSQTASDVKSMDLLIDSSLAGRRLIVWMLGAFAAVALLLGVVGVYALISYLTAQRTSEVGVRMALGARPADVLTLVLKSSLLRVVIGLGIGLALTVAATATLQHYFAGIGSAAPLSLAFAGVTLFLAATLAALIPAARAASINPLHALRKE